MALKTDELLTRGLTQEQVDYVMGEHGKELNPLKADRDNLRTQLQQAQTTLKGFEGVDVAELRGQVSQLQADLANKDTEYQQKMADRDFNDLLNSVVTSSKARNAKAVIAQLDIESLKASKNQEKDIQKAVDAVKKDNDYLFESDRRIPQIVSTTNGPNPNVEDKNTQANEALRSLFGKE